MFLNALQERNEELFLEVCVHAAMANEVLEKEEKEMIFAYCREMNIGEHIPETSGTFEDLVENLSMQTDDKEKRIIILEILGLLKSDGNFDVKEKIFLDKLISGLCVEAGIVDRLNSLLEKYTAIYKEIYTAIYE